MEPALIRPENRFLELLDRAEHGELLPEVLLAELANRFAEEIEHGAASPATPLQLLPREIGQLLIELFAIPRGATLLVAALGAPRPLLKLDGAMRLSVIAEDERTHRTLRATLARGHVAEGPFTRYMAEDTFDYAAVGLIGNATLVAPGHEYDHAAVDGTIPAATAALELALRAVRPGGLVALIGARAAFRNLGSATVRAWIGNRARELGMVTLAPEVADDRLHLAVFEKRAEATPLEPFRAVLQTLRPVPILGAWRRHIEEHGIGLDDYARSCVWARAPIPLVPHG